MIQTDHERPLIVQSDRTLLLEVHSAQFPAARNDINPFSELIKSPEHIHTYQITPISLWNAASAGITADSIISRLAYWSKYPTPETVEFFIRDTVNRFGLLSLHQYTEDESKLFLQVPDDKIYKELLTRKKLLEILSPIENGFLLNIYHRGEIKLQLIKLGYPIDDRIPLKKGDPVPVSLRKVTQSGYEFTIRDYQKEACESVLGDLGPGKGYGTIVLPCGSGKTIVGIRVLEQLQTKTLILTTNVAAVHQWIHEILDKTELTEEQVGEYSGDKKKIADITVCTYQILTWRKDKESDFPHFRIFREHNWGLVIYDEVHMLPAPVFKVTAELQTLFRVGLTATLVREDHREDEVFSLVGPKRFDIPWKELEQKGWIAEANCYEIRVPLPEQLEL